MGPGGMAAAWTLSPARTVGTDGPMETARSGDAFGLVQPPTEPAGPRRVRRVGRLPDVHRLEVAVVGVGEADPLDDGQVPRLPEGLQAGHARMQPEALAEIEHRARVDGHHAPGRRIGGIRVRDHRVEPVVAPVERDQDQRAAARGPGSPRRRGRRRGRGELAPQRRARHRPPRCPPRRATGSAAGSSAVGWARASGSRSGAPRSPVGGGHLSCGRTRGRPGPG